MQHNIPANLGSFLDSSAAPPQLTHLISILFQHRNPIVCLHVYNETIHLALYFVVNKVLSSIT
jgi:hypothetical protein